MNLDVEQPGSGFNARPEENGGDVRPPDQVVDRAAAFAAVTPAIPRKFVYWVLVGAAVLGLGGLAAEHLFSSAGLNPQATTSHAATTTTGSDRSNPTPARPERGAQRIPSFVHGVDHTSGNVGPSSTRSSTRPDSRTR